MTEEVTGKLPFRVVDRTEILSLNYALFADEKSAKVAGEKITKALRQVETEAYDTCAEIAAKYDQGVDAAYAIRSLKETQND